MMTTETRNHQRRSALAPLTLLVLSAPAMGQSFWDVVPELDMRVENQDNVLVSSGDEAGNASRSVLTAGATLTNVSERGRLFLSPRVRADAYMSSDVDDLDSQDYFFVAGGQYRWQTVAAGFRTDYSRQSILRSEFAQALDPDFDVDDPDFEPPDDIDTGRVDFFTEYRKRMDLRGNFDISVSERNTFRFEARHSDVSYTDSGEERARRTPFDITTLTMTIRRRVDERNQVSARMFASQYNSERNENSTNTVGVEGTLDRQLTELWRFNLAVGVERSDYEFIRSAIEERVDNADTNVSFRMRFSQRGQRSTMDVTLGRRVNPNSSGYMVVREELHIQRRHAFSPRVEGRFGVRLSDTRTVGDADRINEREYTRLELGFRWAMRPRLFLTGGYDFTAQEFVREDTTRGSSNLVYLGISYRGLSRL